MAIWYAVSGISPSDESDSFVGQFGTGKLRDTPADFTWSGADDYYLGRDSTFTGRMTVAASGTAAHPIKVGQFGYGKNKPKIVGNTTDTAAVRVSNRSYVDFEDLDISCPVTSSSGNGLEGFFTSSSEGVQIRTRRCDIHDCKNIGLVLFTTVVGVGATVRNGLAEDNTYRRCGYHGSAIYGQVANFRFHGGVWEENALTIDGHGATSFAHRVTYTNTGWSNPGGTVYSRAITAPSGTTGTPSDVYQVTYNKSPYWNLTKNTSTPTTPGLGEFGFSAGTLYVNVGEAPAVGRELKAAVETADISYFNPTVRFTNKVLNEGSGIQADDFSRILVIGGRIEDNEGAAVFLNLGRSSLVTGMISERNVLGGVVASAAPLTKVYNVSAFNGASGIALTNGCDSSDILNAILVANTVGLSVDADSGSVTHGRGIYFGNGTDHSGIVAATDDQFFDPRPYLFADYTMRSTVEIGGVPMRNPLDGAGIFVQGARTFDGRLLDPGRVPIGACRPMLRMR